MTTLRFVLLAVGLFALTFVGVSWGTKGFPVVVAGIVPIRHDSRLPTFEESVKNSLRKQWENSRTSSGVGDCPRDEDDRFDSAAAALRTPADIRVHEAVQNASGQGDFSRDVFPAALRGHDFGLGHPGIGKPRAACVAARLASYHR